MYRRNKSANIVFFMGFEERFANKVKSSNIIHYFKMIFILVF